MKFNNLYSLLLEDALDKKIEKIENSGEIEEPLQLINPVKKKFLRMVYDNLDISIKRHNKFHIFLDFMIREIRERQHFDYDYYEQIEEVNFVKEDSATVAEYENSFREYLQYNLDIKDMSDWEEFDDEIRRRKNKASTKQKFDFDENVEVIKETADWTIIRPWNYEGCRKYGSTDIWCISSDEKWWYNYVLKGYNHYILLSKNSIKFAGDYKGTPREWNVTCIQRDMKGELYITDRGNTVDRGLVGKDVYNFFKQIGLDLDKGKEIFATYNDDKDFSKFIKKNIDIGKHLRRTSVLFRKILDCMPEKAKFGYELISELEMSESANALMILRNHEVDVQLDNYKALRLSAEKGYIKIVGLLIEKGVDVHVLDDYALRVAASRGHLDLIKLLIEKGADVNARDGEAVGWAGTTNNISVLRILLDAGAIIYYSLYHDAKHLKFDEDVEKLIIQHYEKTVNDKLASAKANL